MRAIEIRDYLKSLDGGWVKWEQTVDTFKAGDPQAEVRGIAVILVDHAASEEPGMVGLAEHLRKRFPEIPVHHIPQGCMYTVVGR